MKNLIKLSVFLSVLLISAITFSQTSYAQGCNVTDSTPGGGEVVVCNGVEVNGVETTKVVVK